MEYSFNGKISFDDFVEYNRNFFIGYVLKKKVLLIIGIVFIIILIGFYIYSYMLKKQITFLEDILPLIVFIIIWFFIIRQPKILFKKFYYSNKILQEEQYFIVNDKDISIKSESTSATLTKEKINRINFDKNSIYIYIGIGQVIIIKARFFNDINEFNSVSEFIKENYIK